MSILKNSVSRLKRGIPLCLVAAGLLLANGCGQNDRRNSTSPEALPLSDSDLESNIKAKIDSDPGLRAANLDVDANASENRATISGTVPSEAMRTRAVELAHSAKEGMTLDVKVDVKPPDVSRKEWTEDYSRTAGRMAKESGDTVGDLLDDTWIHTKIVTKLIGDSKTPERKINVDVQKNVVTLRGTVSTQQRKRKQVASLRRPKV